MVQRNFIAALCIVLLAAPVSARTYPPITLDTFMGAMAELKAEFPDRFAELGARAEGPLQRRGCLCET